MNRIQECGCGAAVLVKVALDGEIRSSGGRSEGHVPDEGCNQRSLVAIRDTILRWPQRGPRTARAV